MSFHNNSTSSWPTSAANSPALRQAASDVEAAKGNLIQAPGAALMFTSYGANVRGLLYDGGRPDLVVIDDIEDYKCRLSAWRRQATSEWYDTEVVPALAPRAHVVALCNAVHVDSWSTKLGHRPGARVVTVPAVLREPPTTPECGEFWQAFDAAYREGGKQAAKAFHRQHHRREFDGISSWPQQFPYLDLRSLALDLGRLTFEREYNCRLLAADGGGAWSWADLPEGTREWDPQAPTIGYIDPVTSRVDGRGDFTAAVALRRKREIHQHDAVLLDDSDQQNNADEGDDGEFGAEQGECQQRAQAGRWQGRDDRERMGEALVKHA